MTLLKTSLRLASLAAVMSLLVLAQAFALPVPGSSAGHFNLSSASPSGTRAPSMVDAVLQVDINTSGLTGLDYKIPSGAPIEVILFSPTGSFQSFANESLVVEWTHGSGDGADGWLRYINPYFVVSTMESTPGIQVPSGSQKTYTLTLSTVDLLNTSSATEALIPMVRYGSDWARGYVLAY